MSGSATCRTGCRTKDHSSYGECLRSAGVGVNLEATPNSPLNQNERAYRQARSEGIQPDSTRPHDIQVARAFSDATGVAYDAGNKGETLLKAKGYA